MDTKTDNDEAELSPSNIVDRVVFGPPLPRLRNF